MQKLLQFYAKALATLQDAGNYAAQVTAVYTMDATQWDGTTGRTVTTQVESKDTSTINITVDFDTVNIKGSGLMQVTIGDLLDNSHLDKLFVTGAAGATVDLGRNGNSLTDANGTWELKAGQTMTDRQGVTYDLYQHTSTTDEFVYIQQGVTVL